MNVLLIQPSVEDFYQTRIRTMPLGLTYIAAALRKNNIPVEILDAQVPGKKAALPFPKRFEYMKPYYVSHNVSPFKLFSQYYRFGLSGEELRCIIESSNASVFGISSLSAPYIAQVYETARIIKSVNKKNITVVGGSNASVMPEQLLAHPDVDFIIAGEGEERFPLLISNLINERFREIDGLGYKSSGRIIFKPPLQYIQDINTLPLPARELLNLDYYMIGKQRYTMLLTSRGCPQQCTFCSTHISMGRQFRFRIPENIVAEMKHCYDEHGISIFDIEDDNFTFDRKRLMMFLEIAADVFRGKEVSLMGMNGFSLHNLDEQTLKHMKDAGFSELNIAPVSLDSARIKELKRPFDFNAFRNVTKQAKQVGFSITSYMILGLPFDTIEHMIDALLTLAEEPVLIGPSIFYPTPKTELFTSLAADERVSLDDVELYRSSAYPVETEQFSREELVTVMRIVRILNFIKKVIDGMPAENISSFNEYITQEQKKLPVTECSEKRIVCTRMLSEFERGIVLLFLLIQQRVLCRMILDYKDTEHSRYGYALMPEQCAESVIRLFMAKSEGVNIGGYRSERNVRIAWAARS